MRWERTARCTRNPIRIRKHHCITPSRVSPCVECDGRQSHPDIIRPGVPITTPRHEHVPILLAHRQVWHHPPTHAQGSALSSLSRVRDPGPHTGRAENPHIIGPMLLEVEKCANYMAGVSTVSRFPKRYAWAQGFPLNPESSTRFPSSKYSSSLSSYRRGCQYISSPLYATSPPIHVSRGH